MLSDCLSVLITVRMSHFCHAHVCVCSEIRWAMTPTTTGRIFWWQCDLCTSLCCDEGETVTMPNLSCWGDALKDVQSRVILASSQLPSSALLFHLIGSSPISPCSSHAPQLGAPPMQYSPFSRVFSMGSLWPLCKIQEAWIIWHYLMTRMQQSKH